MSASRNSTTPVQPDPQQTQAIEHVHGPMLVVAGAGTGKTTTLTLRMARLIEKGCARPDEILALTYTKNAAGEMAQRVAQLCPAAQTVQAYTFHDYCFDLLKRHARGFEVLDETDLYIYLRKRIRRLNLKHYIRAANVGQFLRELLDFMRRCQDELITPAQYAAHVDRLERGELPIHRVVKSKDSEAISDEEALARCREISEAYAKVDTWLPDEGLGTFGHMITRAVDLLETQPDLLTQEQARARFILADEFQDSNVAQIRLLALLAGKNANLFAVGDPDQAIYRFRGASSGAFDILLRQFPETQVVRLDRNRRSLSPILQCAHAVIKQNPPIFEKAAIPGVASERQPLVSVREEEATAAGNPLRVGPVEIVVAKKDREAEDVAMMIRERRRTLACPWRGFAVLYRNHDHREEVVDQLAAAGIPFAIDALDVIDTPEVRDLLACAGAVVAPADSASLFRVAALPEFSIDALELNAVMRSAARDTPLYQVLADVAHGSAVLAKLDEVRAEVVQRSRKSGQALRLILKRFSLAGDNLPIQGFLEFVSRWEKKPTTENGELGELLEYLLLLREAGGKVPASAPAQRDAVQLMSAHAAKGLEFGHVFILRVESNSFPNSYKEPLVEFPAELRHPASVVPREGKELHEEEECRLFYVAMTRARDTLTLYGSPGRGKKDPTPSGYLRELLKDGTLQPWRRQREAKAVQTDLFAEAEADCVTVTPSPVSAWITLPLPQPAKLSLSASAMERYGVCPLQFKLRRDWRIPEESPAALQYGGAMHQALRHYYDAVRFERPAPAAEIIQVFRDEFAKAVIVDDYQRELYENQGAQQLQDFVAVAESGVPDVLHTEQEFEVEISGTKVRGRIDRIDRLEDGSVRIVDYKTGKPQNQRSADDSLQLSIYAIAAAQKWGYRASVLALQNLADGSISVTHRSPSQLQAASEKVREVAEEIALGNFEPKRGFPCNWCGFRRLCPATEKNLAVLHNIAPRNSGPARN
jgi:DNA helicase-2/ATP-dependent DNA helicase PcrA